MHQNRLKEIITEYLNEYFPTYESCKKEGRLVNSLASFQKEILDEKFKNLMRQSNIFLSANLWDYSAKNEQCNFNNIKPIKFLFPFNTEDKLVELTIELESRNFDNKYSDENFKCDKKLFNTKYIKEDCDIELKVNKFIFHNSYLPRSIYENDSLKVINICYDFTLYIYDAEILKINQSDEKWLNANYFGKEIKQNKTVPEVKRNGCLSFFSKF